MKNETDQFLRQVELLVKTAPEFSYPLRTIYKQAVNSCNFARLIQPVALEVNLHIGGESVMQDKTDEPAPVARRTAENLDGAYHFPDIDDLAEIIALGQWPEWRYWHAPMETFAWLIQECINQVIHIDHQSLTTKPFALNLLSIAESRQALKYLLFIALPLRFNNCKYILFFTIDA
ncbi:hypothetical protein [Dickeya zeae]|uniref:hypothetical protein n=1 Tax=Dickeya zeae TaxID=204042 RepID=UPI001F3EB0D2|nr:hypothetical protein [Dickeya zeae]UJR62325.1 hypothetical protein HJ586_08955 [Dickeya zeae]